MRLSRLSVRLCRYCRKLAVSQFINLREFADIGPIGHMTMGTTMEDARYSSSRLARAPIGYAGQGPWYLTQAIS